MIRALLIQEFRSTAKTLLTTVGIALLVAALSLTAAALRIPLLGEIGLALGTIAIALISALVLAILAWNYWRTMYGREGYFTMTIPVPGRTLFATKVIYGVIVTVIALVITVLALAVEPMVFALAQGTDISGNYAALWDAIAGVDASVVGLLVGAILLQFVFTIIAGAAVISIGAEGRFNHLGLGAPLIGAVLLYTVMQALGFAAMVFIPLGVKVSGPDAGTLVAQGMLDDIIVSLQNPGANSDPSVVGLGILIVSVIATVLLAWLGARSVERRTSLR